MKKITAIIIILAAITLVMLLTAQKAQSDGYQKGFTMGVTCTQLKLLGQGPECTGK